MVNNYSLSYSALYLKNVFDTGENRKIFLNRISSNDTVQKKTTILCFIKRVNVSTLVECAYRCLNRFTECTLIYYNDAIETLQTSQMSSNR